MRTFGLTSAVFRGRRLGSEDIDDIARHGFGAVCLISSPGQFDLKDAQQFDDIARAALRAGLTVGSVSLPIEEVADALPVALDKGWPSLTARTGACGLHKRAPDTIQNLPKILEKILDRMPASGCTVALQGPAGRHLSAEVTTDLLESFDDARLGVCLDTGHAHLWGGAVEAAEAFSGLITSVLLHDNNGREDLHRLPGAGAINWSEVLTACWKTGFDGPWTIDFVDDAGPAAALARAVGARTRLQAILEDLAQPMTFTE